MYPSSFGTTLTLIYPLKTAEKKCSHRKIQISQNQGPISFQFSVKTIISFCSIWTFLSEQMGPASKINSSRLKLAPLLQALVSLYIRSDQFLTLDLFLRTTPKGWKESTGCPDEELYADTYFI